MVKKAQDVLGPGDKKRAFWKARSSVAPLREAGHTKWNRLFSVLACYLRDPADESIENQIQEVSQSFVFGNRICLRTTDPFWGSPEYAFSTHLQEKTRADDITAYEFSDFEWVLGIPCLEVEATAITNTLVGSEMSLERQAEIMLNWVNVNIQCG